MWDAEPISKPLVVAPARDAVQPLFDRVHGWITTVDHKRLGILYIVYALFFLVIGGIEASIMRLQLIRPHNDFVSPQVFNRMFTMHGTTMIFRWVAQTLGIPHYSFDTWTSSKGR